MQAAGNAPVYQAMSEFGQAENKKNEKLLFIFMFSAYEKNFINPVIWLLFIYCLVPE